MSHLNNDVTVRERAWPQVGHYAMSLIAYSLYSHHLYPVCYSPIHTNCFAIDGCYLVDVICFGNEQQMTLTVCNRVTHLLVYASRDKVGIRRMAASSFIPGRVGLAADVIRLTRFRAKLQIAIGRRSPSHPFTPSCQLSQRPAFSRV